MLTLPDIKSTWNAVMNRKFMAAVSNDFPTFENEDEKTYLLISKVLHLFFFDTKFEKDQYKCLTEKIMDLINENKSPECSTCLNIKNVFENYSEKLPGNESTSDNEAFHSVENSQSSSVKSVEICETFEPTKGVFVPETQIGALNKEVKCNQSPIPETNYSFDTPVKSSENENLDSNHIYDRSPVIGSNNSFNDSILRGSSLCKNTTKACRSLNKNDSQFSTAGNASQSDLDARNEETINFDDNSAPQDKSEAIQLQNHVSPSILGLGFNNVSYTTARTSFSGKNYDSQDLTQDKTIIIKNQNPLESSTNSNLKNPNESLLKLKFGRKLAKSDTSKLSRKTRTNSSRLEDVKVVFDSKRNENESENAQRFDSADSGTTPDQNEHKKKMNFFGAVPARGRLAKMASELNITHFNEEAEAKSRLTNNEILLVLTTTDKSVKSIKRTSDESRPGKENDGSFNPNENTKRFKEKCAISNKQKSTKNMDKNNSFDVLPEQDDAEPNFAHRHKAIRGKKERAKLKGFDCLHCEQYYDAKCSSDAHREAVVNKVSKHRAKYNPVTNTPPHIWKLDFSEDLSDDVKK